MQINDQLMTDTLLISSTTRKASPVT